MKHSASILVRDPEGFILLLERGGESHQFRGMWEFPGGKIDPGQSVAEAAVREAAEEAGLVVPALPAEPEKVVAVGNGEVDYAFFTHDFTACRPPVVLSDEHTACQWVKPTKLRSMAAEGKIMTPHLEFFERNWLKRQVETFSSTELPAYRIYAGVILSILDKLRARWAPLAITQARPKSIDSFAGKCLRKADKYDDPVHQLTDLCGGRIIASTEREADLLCRQIRRTFEIVEDDDTAMRHALDAFGYLSVHFLVRIPENATEMLGVPVPPEIGRRVAEIQVRTLLQHAHSEVTHDRLYKSGFKPPRHCEREAARVAAALEAADAEFGRFVAQLDAYVGEYAALMPPAERQRLIDDQRLLIELEPDERKKPALALKIAHLARPAWEWETLVEALDRHVDTSAPCAETIRMELGHALCRLHPADPRNQEFARGVDLLLSVARPEDGLDGFLENDERIRRATALGWLGRALTRAPGRRDLARHCLQIAVRLAPEDPYHLCSLVELDVIATSQVGHLDLLEPSLRAAAERCEAHVKAGIEVNRAWLTLAKIRLFLDDEAMALEALCLAARSTENPRPLADIRRTLALIKDAIGSKRPSVAALERTARLLARNAELRHAKAQRSTWDRRGLEQAAQLDPARPVLIIAGTTEPIDDNRLAAYDSHLRAALATCDAQVLSGGTTAGIFGRLASIAKEREAVPSSGRFLGYLPETLPAGAQAAPSPVELVKTPGSRDFSIHEPLQMWTDLLVSGVDPERVVLLCLGGGTASAAELSLAWAFRAKSAVIDDRSLACEQFRKMLAWSIDHGSGGLLVPDDPATLSAMFCLRATNPDPEWETTWEEPGKAVHEAYLRNQSSRSTQPNLLPWSHLPPPLKHSNRHQAFYAAEILRSHGFLLERRDLPPDRIPVFEFADDAGDEALIERMAEAEHGRWNAERLHEGWRFGEKKDAERKTSPHLVPWAMLPDEIKDHDRHAVRQWPAILARAGWEVKRRIAA